MKLMDEFFVVIVKEKCSNYYDLNSTFFVFKFSLLKNIYYFTSSRQQLTSNCGSKTIFLQKIFKTPFNN
jgi:hypothetical protein